MTRNDTQTIEKTGADPATKAEHAFRAAAPAPAGLHVEEGRTTPMAALFPNAERAQDALARLFRAGFHVEQISIVTATPEDMEIDEVETRRSPEDAAKRWASLGGVLGGLTGSGIAAGFVATAGLGALAVTGPLFLGLTSGAVIGSLVAAMVRRGFEPEIAQRYLRAACQGGTLLVVDVRNDEQARQAGVAFREAGALRDA